MAFIQQLRLLLWKNGLTVIRQPLWSLTLIIWPLIIFIIIAVTRNQFPPVVKETCYVGPRNLPSSGFFPFLQTLMCNTDSNCHNTSRLVDTAESNPPRSAVKSRSSTSRRKSPLASLIHGGSTSAFTLPKFDDHNNPVAIIEVFQKMIGRPHQGNQSVSRMNTTVLGDKESLKTMLASVSVLKRSICSLLLPLINSSSPDAISLSVVTFCKSNDTVLEASLTTLNQVLTEMMHSNPDEMMTLAGAGVMVFNQLQNRTSLWESLLALPKLLASGLVDEGLSNTQVLLRNVQSVLRSIEKNFNQTSATLTPLHPVLAAGIDSIYYIQNWPGKGVKIPLGEIVTLENDTFSQSLKPFLQNVKIPLDQAISLALNRHLPLSQLCNNSDSPLWLQQACRTDAVKMLLIISPNEVVKQVLLSWSEKVSMHDMTFVKGLLHSLMGVGGSSKSRNRRSVMAEPQNIEERLFLGVGQVVLELVELVPELDNVVQGVLKVAFQSIRSGTLAIDTIEETIENVLKDTDQVKSIITTMLSNQAQASVWISRVMDAALEVFFKALTSDSLTCQEILGPFEFILDTETVGIDVSRAAICQNGAVFDLSLTKEWLPLVEKIDLLVKVLTGPTNYTVTLPMILSEWHKLYNTSMEFGKLVDQLTVRLGAAYWMNWIPGNHLPDFTQTLQQSVVLFMVKLGEQIERTPLWPSMKNYFHMLFWVLKYNPGVTTSPANCSADFNLTITCDTGFAWQPFVQGMAKALISSTQEVWVNCLKGTLHLLQHMFGDVYKHLATTSLKLAIKSGGALSDFLIELMINLDTFLRDVSTLPDSSLNNTSIMIPKLQVLLKSVGLEPLLPLFLSDGPLNASTIIHVASKIGRLNQHIFTFNESDPTLPELERQILNFLSLEGELTLSLSQIMGGVLLRYTDYFDPQAVAQLKKDIQAFTNQTSSGMVEIILTAMETLKKVLDAPNGDPTDVILGYIRQLQELVMSLYKLRKVEQQVLPSGQVSPELLTDLHLLARDFLKLLTPEGIQNLTQLGPDNAQIVLIQKLVAFLPVGVRTEATDFLMDFKELQSHIHKCAVGQDCLAGVSEIITFLDEIFDLMLTANGTVSIKVFPANVSLAEREELISLVFSIILRPNDASAVKTVKQTLHFVKLLLAKSDITVSDVQNALKQSNLTLPELNSIAALLGAADVKSLLASVLEIINTRPCFEPGLNLMETAQCVTGLVKGVSDFLGGVPALRNQTVILSLIPPIFNQTFKDILQANFSASPNLVVAYSLNKTLANIKLNLQANHLNSPEIMREIQVLERLIQLISNMEPFITLNSTLMADPTYAQKVYLEIIDWYLKRVENVSNSSSLAQFLQPIFAITRMQIAIQLAQTNYQLSVTQHIEYLIHNLQYPINGTGLSKIGLTTVAIMRGLVDIVKVNLEAQNNMAAPMMLFNSTILNAITTDVNKYLNVTEEWMKQPNVQMILTSMLHWGNPSMNISTPLTDINRLLPTFSIFLSKIEVTYLSAIMQITNSLTTALKIAEQPGGLQSDGFVTAIENAFTRTMQLLIQNTGPLSQSVQRDLQEIMGGIVTLSVQPNMSFTSSRNLSLHILGKAESVIQKTVPEPYAVYLLSAIKVAETFVESIGTTFGQDVWNIMILNVMKTVEGLLPPNSPARPYISTFINVTHSILKSDQGNASFWESFAKASLGDAAMLIGQLLNQSTGPLPLSVLLDLQDMVGGIVRFGLQPDMSFASSRNLSLLILGKVESVIQKTVPEPYAVYLLPVIKVAETFVESIGTTFGQDVWNIMILNVMKTVEGLLPPNNPARPYISTFIRVTHSILKSDQGNASFWEDFAKASLEDAAMLIGQTMQLLNQSIGSLPPSVLRDLQEILGGLVRFGLHPDMSFASSRNLSLLILGKVESVIQKTVPEPNAVYLLPVIKVAETFVESIGTTFGQDVWNIMILNVMKTVEGLLPPNNPARPFISTFIRVTHSILKSDQGNASFWEDFAKASLEDAAMLIGQLLNQSTGPLPPSVLLDLQEILGGLVRFGLHPDMSFASSRNLSLLILWKAESVIQKTVPEPYAVYLLPVIKVAETFVESIGTTFGQDVWNIMILNVMKTVEGLLPPNNPARPYISTFINVTQSILKSDLGNTSFWELFEKASLEDAPMLIGQLGRLLNMLFRGIPDLQGPVGSSVKIATHLSALLEQLLNGTMLVDQRMWKNLEMMLQTLLSSLEETELWHNVTSVVPLIEAIVQNLVDTTKAENALILNLQTPVLNLMREVARSANSTNVNLTEVTEKLQSAIERTVEATQQTNGTLGCSDALKLWEPFSVAAGLSPETMAGWCNVGLQPVLEAFAADPSQMTHMDAGPKTANATAARMVALVQSLYHLSLNQSQAMEQLILALSQQFSTLTGRPLSPEAVHHWNKQLQEAQIQNSLATISMLTDELRKVAPFLQPYMSALEKALHHFVSNSNLLMNDSASQQLLTQTLGIFLDTANITTGDLLAAILSGDSSLLNEATIVKTMKELVKLMKELGLLGDSPEDYQALEELLASAEMAALARKVLHLIQWLSSARTSGVDLLLQLMRRMYEIAESVLSLLTKLKVELPPNSELFRDLAGNAIAMLQQLFRTMGRPPPGIPPGTVPHPMMIGQAMTSSNHTARTRHRREALMMPMRQPMDDFIDLFYIDYHSMFQALAVPPSSAEILDTVHVLFSNPNMKTVLTGATQELPWGLNSSKEDTISGALGVLSFLTLPTGSQFSSMDLLKNVVDLLPDGIPFMAELKDLTKALASESEENLLLLQQTFQTVMVLFQGNMTEQQLNMLKSQLCKLESTESMQQVLQFFSIKPGELCNTILPGLEMLVNSLIGNVTLLTDAIFQTVIGEPKNYDVESSWTSPLGQGLSFDPSNLRSLNINVTSPGDVTVGELLRDQAAFAKDLQKQVDISPAALTRLLETVVPNNNLEILSRLMDMRHCTSSSPLTNEWDPLLLKTLCSMTAAQWYAFALLMVRHVNIEKLIYRIVLPEDVQSLVAVMLQMAESLVHMMDEISPAINMLQSYLRSVDDLNLMVNSEFSQMSRGHRSSISTKATFVTISRALCSNGIMALFGISKLPDTSESGPSFPGGERREEMIDRFKIPRNATPFCMNMYLDMVNTTGGAIAWAFLKPMLMGEILFTPDTPVTRDIMEKANATLQEFANLRKNSQDWIQSSNSILQSAQLLSQTLPMLQNSLSNTFVKNFIQMQTNIDVDQMKDSLSLFSNMTVMLEKNKQLVAQMSTLSKLMVQLSSCIKFDRYRGYDTAEELNAEAQELAKDRNLYASVIFKLPKDDKSSNGSTDAPLPPRVDYTIRMHMDNVMRTDRVRNNFFIKDPHIVAHLTMRYNRGFIYLQENIDRAIIQTQTGSRATDMAVQLQPFPYPCHLRDEYLEAISFVFPIMLMLAWVLFVADFVKKLVHERELRLHEYMKMMGVNPLSHFFAWFVECATYLLVTIVILTLVLKQGKILPSSDGFLLFLYLCDYGLSVLAFSYLVGSFFDQTYIAGLSGSLLYILSFFPFIVVMAMETGLTFTQKSLLSLFSPTCFSYASQYVSRYEAQGEGIQWSNSYSSPIADDTASFGWLCWLMLIDSVLYFMIGVYVRMVFPGKYGIPTPWYFPFKPSFWADLCCCLKSKTTPGKGLFFSNIMQNNQPVFSEDEGKGKSEQLSFQAGQDFSEAPVGVAIRNLSKLYGERVAIQNLNVSFHEGHVTSLLGHNGAGKTTTMSLLTGLFAPTSGAIDVYGRDMQSNIDDVRKELGVCMQYDVLFDHMTTKEHLLLYGQIKAPQWTRGELHEQVRTILEDMGMYAHRHKRVGTLSGGMKRKLSISIAFIGGSRVVVLDEPTTGVDPCSRRSIWDIVIQHKKNRTIIMSTHHLDEAEVLSDRIAFLERGGLKCCGSPLELKDKLGQGYKLTLTKKLHNIESEGMDSMELKHFIQAHVPEARLEEAQGGDVAYSLPPFNSSNASSYRSLLTALDANLDALQLGGYGISHTTLEEVFLQLTHDNADTESVPLSISETVPDTVSDSGSVDSFPSDVDDKIKLTGSSAVTGMALAWQQAMAILVKRFQHSRRDWKGLIAQIVLPILFVTFAMGLSSIKKDLQHYPELELSPALYNIGPSFAFFRNQNPSAEKLVGSMMSFPGMDNACLDKPDNPVCARNTNQWFSSGNNSKGFSICECTSQEQVCQEDNYQPPHKQIPSSQVVYNLSGIHLEKYLVATANDFIRDRYGGFDFGMRLPTDLQMDLRSVPKNRTLSKVWFNPEGHHTMPAYLNSLNNIILRSNLPEDKDPRKYAISVSSHPYFGRADDEDAIVQGMLQILVAMCVLTGYSITTASFAIYEVSEHHSGSKRLQHIAGISEPFYWGVNFLYDMFIYMIPVSLTVAVVAIFQIPAFSDRQNLGAVCLLLVLFGFSTFPWMYLLSGVFKDAEMAFITYVCINLFISINTIMSTSILYFLSQISSQEVIVNIFDQLCHAFLIFPQFNFGNGLMKLARMNIKVQILSGYGIDAYENPFSTECLGWLFLASFIQGVVFFALRLLLNKSLLRKVRHLICGRKTVPRGANEDEDEDVAAEHLRVSSGAASTDILQVNQLTKIYQHLKRKVHAVKKLSVGIPAGECFGLLGVNGAGKTTTFKMLTGDVSPTDGTAQIRDWDGRLVDIMECRSKGINIGYCPQEDALDNLLTGEEHLYFYARIRGIPKKDIEGVVNYLLKRLELIYHRNIITDGYSCGTRRKLSTALALIGHPQILLLDEPSSGMDPRTKRHLWKIISEEVKGKCAVVLTSHSMEECEALCSRLAIMVKGQFQCLGSLQHIKNRFGSGFTVKMYLAQASCDAGAITGFMRRRFPSTYLKDHHSTMVEYHVPVAPGGVADIFDQLESNKTALQIKHFSVSQTTLDEVFINFAMGKIGMETIPIDDEEEEEMGVVDITKAVDT